MTDTAQQASTQPNISEKHGISYATLHLHLRCDLQRYIEQGVPTGGFLDAVLSNDLARAVSKADDINLGIISDIVRWLYNQAPSKCWGSRAAVDAWLKMGGLIGEERAA